MITTLVQASLWQHEPMKLTWSSNCDFMLTLALHASIAHTWTIYMFMFPDSVCLFISLLNHECAFLSTGFLGNVIVMVVYVGMRWKLTVACQFMTWITCTLLLPSRSRLRLKNAVEWIDGMMDELWKKKHFK